MAQHCFWQSLDRSLHCGLSLLTQQNLLHVESKSRVSTILPVILPIAMSWYGPKHLLHVLKQQIFQQRAGPPLKVWLSPPNPPALWPQPLLKGENRFLERQGQPVGQRLRIRTGFQLFPLKISKGQPFWWWQWHHLYETAAVGSHTDCPFSQAD